MQGTLTAEGIPEGIDAEQALFYFTIDESASSLFDLNLQITNFTVPDEDQDYDDFTAWQPTVVFYPINGYSWYIHSALSSRLKPSNHNKDPPPPFHPFSFAF